ncbi:MAG: prohibitin family protein [bacterium]
MSLLILAFVAIYFFDYVFITVYPGHAGVLFRRFFSRGTVIDKIYPEGLNIIEPWNKMYIYDVRIQRATKHVDVLSQNGLTISLDVTVFFHVDYGNVAKLHQVVGPEYIEKILIPITISSTREIVGSYYPEEIYTTGTHILQEEILLESIKQVGDIPIVFDEMIIETIKLPKLINNAIEAKLRQEQAYLEYQFRLKKEEQEKQRKIIEAEGIKRYHDIISSSITEDLLRFKGIQATLELSTSPNSKVVVIGSGRDGLPIILNAEPQPGNETGR